MSRAIILPSLLSNGKHELRRCRLLSDLNNNRALNIFSTLSIFSICNNTHPRSSNRSISNRAAAASVVASSSSSHSIFGSSFNAAAAFSPAEIFHSDPCDETLIPLTSLCDPCDDTPVPATLNQSLVAAAAKDGAEDGKPCYFDYQATTPMDPRVLDAMMPFFKDMFGNAHSRSHVYGWEAEKHVEYARQEIAGLLGCSPKEIIFTSGATESNNMVIKGLASFHAQSDKYNHIITTQIEHKCVLASCRDVQEKYGWDITYLPVNSDGLINLEQLEQAIRPTTALVSVMMVNNEIGVVQPMEQIGEICKRKNVLLHSDSAQGCGKIPISVDKLNIDLMSISGHKLYGPKGIGALYIRNKKPRIRLHPLISGGGQERGLRSGTLPTPLVVGLGKACSIAMNEMTKDHEKVTALSERLYSRIMAGLPKVVLNGSAMYRYCGNLNLSFEAVEGESLIMALKNVVAVSSGSACTSASLEPSYVLRAIGVNEALAHTSLRFGFGRFSTTDEVDAVAAAVIESVRKLRDMSPLWECDDGDTKPIWT